MIREIGVEEFAPLYRRHIVEDFPRAERRPLGAIQSLYARGRYSCQIMEEDGELLAYACFIGDPALPYLLLDYFAVVSERRGSGIGSRFLAEIRDGCRLGGIIIETEQPKNENPPEELETRERRIRFYLKCGAVMSDYVWRAFGVDYNLMWLPAGKRASCVDVGEAVERIYALTMPDFVRRRATSLTKIQ